MGGDRGTPRPLVRVQQQHGAEAPALLPPEVLAQDRKPVAQALGNGRKRERVEHRRGRSGRGDEYFAAAGDEPHLRYGEGTSGRIVLTRVVNRVGHESLLYL